MGSQVCIRLIRVREILTGITEPKTSLLDTMEHLEASMMFH